MQRKVGSEHQENLTIQERVAKNIGELMHRLKITPVDLSMLTKINKTTITRCLSGDTAPSLETLSKIAQALQTTPDKLLARSTRDVSLTGIETIDDAVFDMMDALWSNVDTAQRLIGHRIHPNYRLWYCDAPTAEEAIGPNFIDEISMNLSHPHAVENIVHSAAVLSDTSIILHASSISVYPLRSSELPRKIKHDKVAKTEVIDVWELTHTIDEIKKRKDLKWQIMARKLKILRESQEV